MGYYTEYLSTIFKGPWATTLKERLEARRAIKSLGKADKAIYKKLPELVEKEHRVTAAIKTEKKTIKNLRLAATKGYALAFNLSTMDFAVLEAINKLMDAWKKVKSMSRSDKASKRFEQISKLFATAMYNAVKTAEEEEREEMKDIMILVNENANKNREQFMEAVRLRFQNIKDMSILTRFAIRGEIKEEKRMLDRMNYLTDRLNKVIEHTKKSGLDKAMTELEEIIKESSGDVERAFFEAHQIKKRDFLLMLKLLANGEVLRGMNKKWIQMHFMPAMPLKEIEAGLNKVEVKIAGEFHTVSQALRISINGLQKLEKRFWAEA